MNIIEKEHIYEISYRRNVGGKGLEQIEVKQKDNLKYNNFNYVESDDDFKAFLKKYEDIYNKEVEIKETDSVYFFKESKYPRFKFNANCKNNKTINIKKADVIITPKFDIVYNARYTYYKNKKLIVCEDTNHVFIPNYAEGVYNDILEPYFHKGNYDDNMIAFLKQRLLITGNAKVIYADTLYQNVTPQFLRDLYENIDKCISEINLEKYLSKESSELTDDIHKQLDLMLASKDAGTVELGMKMLINFDIDKNALKVGLLIRRHRDILSKNKAATSVGFKNILKQLGINLQDGVPTLDYINNLYKNTQDEENKALMLDAFRKQLHAHLIESYEGYVRGKNVPTSINIDIN